MVQFYLHGKHDIMPSGKIKSLQNGIDNFKEENAGEKHTKMRTVVVPGLNDYKCYFFFSIFQVLNIWYLGICIFFFALSKDKCSMQSNRATVQEYSLVMHHVACSVTQSCPTL